MKFTILIVNYNTSELLYECLGALMNSFYKNLRIIVFDNNSHDNLTKVIKKHKNVIFIKSKENIGLTKALNKMIKKYKSDIYLIMHPDVIINKRTIPRMLWFYEKYKPGISTCKAFYPNGKLFMNTIRFPELKYLIGEHIPGMKGIYLRDWNHKNIKEVDIVSSCFMLIDKKTISLVGLFDENFPQWSVEWDYCYRAKQKKVKILFNPYAKIIHYEKYSANAQELVKETGYKKDAYKIAAKYLEPKFEFYRKHYPEKFNKFRTYAIWFLRLKILRHFFNRERKDAYKKAIEMCKRQEL